MTELEGQTVGYRSKEKRPLVVPILALLCLSICLISLGLHRRTATAGDARAAEAETYDLFELRAEMAWLHYDLLIAGLSAELDGSTPSAAMLESFGDQRAVAIAELTELADRDGYVGDAAADLLAGYSKGYGSTWPYDPFRLEADHYLGFAPDVGPLHFAADRRVSASMTSSMVARLVLVDALAKALDEQPTPVSPWAAEFVEFTTEVLSEAPGWTGPTRNDPIQGNYVGDSLAIPTSSIAGFQELQLVWDYDQWLVASAETEAAGQAPLSIDELREASAAASAGLDAAVLQQIDNSRGEGPEAGRFGETALILISALSGTAALGGGVAILFRRRARHRTLADAAFTDSLTGAGNRRYLNEEVRSRCHRRHHHHVVAMIDLDRFKLVNDTWGHDVGDAILVTAARRLDGFVRAATARSTQGEGSVIRLGGDEFAVVLHSPDRFNLHVLEAELRSVAGPVDVGVGTPVSLELSVGFAESFQPIDVDDLVKGADLEVYRDKRSGVEDQDGEASTQPSSLSVDLR